MRISDWSSDVCSSDLDCLRRTCTRQWPDLSLVKVAISCALRVQRAVVEGRIGAKSSAHGSAHAQFMSLILLDKRLNYKRKMLAIAPMMDWTDTHCRVFHRLLAPHARLYTEMVHANAVDRKSTRLNSSH